ncbi:uncharacterized protein G2W53_023425 [Senna tora]|uniref:Uncharacterized protein n=1 Tax=Senna tora TaxID=362788 RepID=A0A834WC75_9FABA|nr:uncharacterized protein G2W53_023425 [Senna tora]
MCRGGEIRFVIFSTSIIGHISALQAAAARSILAAKSRELVGEEHSSQCGKFSILDCLDMGAGTLGCSVKETVKLFFNNMKTARVEIAREQAIETALVDAASQGMSKKESSKYAEKYGKKAEKMASREANRILGPIISSGWDFFEAMYYGGSSTEGFLRGAGTLIGTYGGAFFGEQCVGRFGYVVGSQMGSWAGGRIGLMIYDVLNGIRFLLQFPLSLTHNSQHSHF